MIVVKDSAGLNYKLRFIHEGAHRYEATVAPHNLESTITRVWQSFGASEILYEDIPNGRTKAIRFPGRKYK